MANGYNLGRRLTPAARAGGRPAEDACACRAEALERRLLMAAGDLDPRYSADGRATFPVAGATDLHVAAAAVDPIDGSTVIVADANSTTSGTRDFVVFRVKADGQPDTAFGTDGTG